MTRQNFELIARTLSESIEAAKVETTDPLIRRAELLGIHRVALKFAVTLATTNPRFDVGRFLAASGFDGGVS